MVPGQDAAPQDGHPQEPHRPGLATKLNRLRAGVLGANTGSSRLPVWWSVWPGPRTTGVGFSWPGLAGLVAGALSMAGGEYVSVSTHTEKAAILLERWELEHLPEEELTELRAF